MNTYWSSNMLQALNNGNIKMNGMFFPACHNFISLVEKANT